MTRLGRDQLPEHGDNKGKLEPLSTCQAGNQIQWCWESNLDSRTAVTHWFALNTAQRRLREQHMMSILRLVIGRNKHSCLYVKSLTICGSCSSFYGIKRTKCCFIKGIKCRSRFTLILEENSRSFWHFLLQKNQENILQKQIKECLA